MAMELSPSETRVLGALLEKQLTTPDLYPLTLNGLRLACNQSTNRDPIVDYDDQLLRNALHGLERRGLVRLASGAGSRAPKYRHLLAERLPLDSPERAILCVLMLRGRQTPGELKQRTERMHPFADLAEVHETLHKLIERDLVMRLERRPGQKEERYQQLLSETPEGPGGDAQMPAGLTQAAFTAHDSPPIASPAATAGGTAGAAGAPASASAEDLAELTARVERLEAELAQLRGRLAIPAGEPA